MDTPLHYVSGTEQKQKKQKENEKWTDPWQSRKKGSAKIEIDCDSESLCQ
jgi:hypothetical protein